MLSLVELIIGSPCRGQPSLTKVVFTPSNILCQTLTKLGQYAEKLFLLLELCYWNVNVAKINEWIFKKAPV